MVELNPVNRLNYLVNLNIAPGFNEQFEKEVRYGSPFLVFTHEAHADGIGAAITIEHLLKLSRQVGREPKLKGFVLPAARSFTDGQQGRRLQAAYLFFNLLTARKGLLVLPYTREKDGEEYGMKRKHTSREVMPLGRKIQKGFAPAVFAGGSVEAGRHDQGADPEDIHGLQRLTGTDLLAVSRLVKSVNRERKMFFVIIGLHGGYRLQSPNKEKRYPTISGLTTYFGWPERFPPHARHVKMDANLGTIIHEDTMAERFGNDWMKAGKDKSGTGIKRVQAINNFIMESAALLVPPHARGYYATKAIELEDFS